MNAHPLQKTIIDREKRIVIFFQNVPKMPEAI